MILLDGLDKHDDVHCPKPVAARSSSFHPVTRVQTPTPSLPDYEASQAQLRPTTLTYTQIQDKRKRRRRCRRLTVYALAAYFVVTVVIGIPIIVLKLKKKITMKSNPYQSWADNASLPPRTITLGDAPLRISAAKQCNSWNVKDRPDGSMFLSELEYRIPSNGSIFLNTNITYASNATYLNQFAGSLFVDVNDDISVSDNVVHVSMHHSSRELGNSTNVCQMATGQGSGIYLFAPQTLSMTDALTFNITLLLPRNNTSPRYIPQLLCHLPHFQHTYKQLDPHIIFGNVIFGGAMSGVYVESLTAGTAIVKASSAEISGKFKVTQQLSLETVSAPINVDAHLYSDGDSKKPTLMHLNTGNSVLNANVTLYLPPTADEDSDSYSDETSYSRGPQFITDAETFNAPLNVVVAHDPDSPPANIRLHAANNLGNTRVSLDSRYAGTFDVSTMFAQADVLAWDGSSFSHYYDLDGDSIDDESDDDGDEVLLANSNPTSSSNSTSTSDGDSDDDGDDTVVKSKVHFYLPSLTTTSTGEGASATGGRCLEYDLISSSEIQGWVGIAPRPSLGAQRKYDNMSHVSVVSSLNGAQLILQP